METSDYKHLYCFLLAGSVVNHSTAQGPSVPSNWWQYPYPYDVVALAGAQGQLQRENLIDGYTESPAKKRKCFDPKIGKLEKGKKKCLKSLDKARRVDGYCNDLDNPAAGVINYRLGRNVPLKVTSQDYCNLYKPNPRDISRKLMQRSEFIPATSINILVAGWIQFMIHDWFDSGTNDRSRIMEVSLEDDDPEFNETMKIPATRSDDCTPLPGINKDICKRLPDDFSYCKDVKDYDTYQNTVTH